MPRHFRPLALLHVAVLLAGAQLARGQVEVWEVQRVGQRTPLEISGGMGLGSDMRIFTNAFTISQQGSGTRLDHFRIPSDGSVPVETRITVTSDTVSGLSQKVAYMPSGEAFTSYIDNGRIMAQHSTDFGRTWNRMTISNQPSYGETQSRTSLTEDVISAHHGNFRKGVGERTGPVSVELIAFSSSTGVRVGAPILIERLPPGHTATISQVVTQMQLSPGETYLVYARVTSGGATIAGLASYVDATTRDGSVVLMARAD